MYNTATTQMTKCRLCIYANAVTGLYLSMLTHWDRVTHICVGKLTIIGSDNGLSPGRRQAIIWTNAGILLIGPPRNKLQWISNQNSYIFIQENPFQNVVWKRGPFCVGPNVFTPQVQDVNMYGTYTVSLLCLSDCLLTPRQHDCYLADNFSKCIPFAPITLHLVW